MPVEFVRQEEGKDTMVDPVVLFGEHPYDQQNCGCTRWAVEENLISEGEQEPALGVRELKVSEGVLRTYDRARSDFHRLKDWGQRYRWTGSRFVSIHDSHITDEMEVYVLDEGKMVPYVGQERIWTEEQYTQEFERRRRLEMLQEHTHFAMVLIGEVGLGSDLLQIYEEGARLDETQTVGYWSPRPTLDNYEPALKPDPMPMAEWTLGERLGWFFGAAPRVAQMNEYYDREQLSERVYLEMEARRLTRERRVELAEKERQRRRENPDDLVGFTRIYVTPDEVFNEQGVTELSEEVMLYLVAGYIIIVREPEQQAGWPRNLLAKKQRPETMMLVPLKRADAEKLMPEEEI